MIRFYFRWPPRMIRKVKTILLLTAVIILAMFLIQSLLITLGIGETGEEFIASSQSHVEIRVGFLKRIYSVLGMDTQTYKKILSGSLAPLGAAQVSEGNGYLVAMLQAVLDVDPSNPRSFFGQGMTALGTMEVLAAASMESYPLFEDEAIVEPPNMFFEEAEKTIQNSPAQDQAVLQGAEVIILNTHNAETYKMTDGVSKKEGENAGVVKVAAQLERILNEKYQITTDRSETIHDYPKFEESYSNSGDTMQKLLRRNPHARVVIDIHRDAGYDKPLTATIKGKKCARVRLIIGSDARLPHQDWMKNLEFARQVTDKMDEIYPGLSLGYRIQSGRYNQHLHPRAILIEVGNDHNSLDEAYQSAELFAAVLNELLRAQ